MSNHPFQVWINPDVLERLNMYATEALPTEIGGFAKIEESEDNVFVTDIFIPEQQATGGTFDITPAMDNEFMREMMKQGRREELPMWKSIVHSHPVGMGPSMSSTDVEAIKRKAEDTECYSLIISASRNADSTKMFMHYCANVFGKQMIFRDIPVMPGWQTERIAIADEVAKDAVEKLGAELTESDMKMIQSKMRELICELPPTFETERKKLREAIKAEVKAKVSNRTYRSWSPTPRTGFQLPANTIGQSSYKNRKQIDHSDRADLEQAWKNCQRLYSIGYDMEDFTNPNPNHVVTKQQAKKARKLHKRAIIELNKELRKIGGVGMGDLVLINQAGIESVPSAVDLLTDPVEVEDFTIKNGLIAYEVGGDVFWHDELEVMTQYEDLMEWSASNDEIEAEKGVVSA